MPYLLTCQAVFQGMPTYVQPLHDAIAGAGFGVDPTSIYFSVQEDTLNEPIPYVVVPLHQGVPQFQRAKATLALSPGDASTTVYGPCLVISDVEAFGLDGADPRLTHANPIERKTVPPAPTPSTGRPDVQAQAERRETQ